MSTRDIRLSKRAPPMFALTRDLAAYDRGHKDVASAPQKLATIQLAASADPAPLVCKGKGVPPLAVAASAGVSRSRYLVMLTWCFTFFNTVRVLAYLPTVIAIVQQGDSSQHSLFTWLTWLGANITMAAWLFEQNGACLNRAVAVNVANACMCLTTVAVIVAFRL